MDWRSIEREDVRHRVGARALNIFLRRYALLHPSFDKLSFICIVRTRIHVPPPSMKGWKFFSNASW